MKKYALLLDFDGVIAKSEHLYRKVEQQLFDRHGVQLSDDEWANIKGISAGNFFKLVTEKYIPGMKYEDAKEEIESNLLKTFQNELDYVPGFQAIESDLKTNFHVAIVTATGRKIMDWIFANTHVNPRYDLIVTGDDVQHPKPHPQPYLNAAAGLNTPVENCLVIEDSINGLRSGKNAGAKVLAFTTSLDKKYLLEADFFAPDFSPLTVDLLMNYLEN